MSCADMRMVAAKEQWTWDSFRYAGDMNTLFLLQVQPYQRSHPDLATVPHIHRSWVSVSLASPGRGTNAKL